MFLLGVFWKRASAISAKLTLWIGSALGIVVFAVGKLGGQTGPAVWLESLTGGSFMMAAFYLFCICVTMQGLISLRWPAGRSEIESGLYWNSPMEPLRDKGWPGLANYRFLAGLLLAVMAILYYFFR